MFSMFIWLHDIGIPTAKLRLPGLRSLTEGGILLTNAPRRVPSVPLQHKHHQPTILYSDSSWSICRCEGLGLSVQRSGFKLQGSVCAAQARCPLRRLSVSRQGATSLEGINNLAALNLEPDKLCNLDNKCVYCKLLGLISETEPAADLRAVVSRRSPSPAGRKTSARCPPRPRAPEAWDNHNNNNNNNNHILITIIVMTTIMTIDASDNDNDNDTTVLMRSSQRRQRRQRPAPLSRLPTHVHVHVHEHMCIDIHI